MKTYFFICVVVCFACNQGKHNPNEKDKIGFTKEEDTSNKSDLVHVMSNLLELNQIEGKVYFKNKLFTGFKVDAYDKNVFKLKEQYLAGVRQGISKKWFKNGTLSYSANYKKGKLHGVTESWWINGKIRSRSKFVDGVGQGFQEQWYKSGNLFKKIHLVNGKESGLQQSWRENGKLYNNYEVRNGRVFGLKRASLCFQLEDENVLIDN